MSYCRFQNTLIDLQDCWNALEDVDNPKEVLSPEEHDAFIRLMKLCNLFAGCYFDDDGN